MEIDYAGYVISRNRHRRHMTKTEIAECVVKARTWKKDGRPSKEASLEKPYHDDKVSAPKTNKELAEEAGVSIPTISRAKAKVVGKKPKAPTAPKKPKQESKHRTQIDKLQDDHDKLRKQVQSLSSQLSDSQEATRKANNEIQSLKKIMDGDHVKEFKKLKDQLDKSKIRVNELTEESNSWRRKSLYWKEECRKLKENMEAK